MIEIDEFLAQSGIDRRLLEEWIEREWLLPERKAERVILSDIDAARARFIRDLKSDLGVNDEGIEIVLHLVDQLHGLRRAVTHLRAEIRVAPLRRLRGRRPR
jgi:chaperone modulatory protein CbpM